LTRRVAVLSLLITLTLPVLAGAAQSVSTGAIEGSVSTPKPAVRLAGALLAVTDRRGAEVARTASDGEGRFTIGDLPVGQYRVVVSLEGFQAADMPVVVAAGKTTILDFELPISVLAERVEVVAPALPGAPDTFGAAETLDVTAQEAYSTGGGFQAALRLLASVIQSPGGLSIKGGRPTQATTQLGAGTMMDPSTGLVPLTLPPDAIDSVEVLANPYAVEFGRFSSGLVVLRSKSGGDEWKVRANNLDPGFRTERGHDFHIIGLRVFAPRVEVGGPLIKDRLALKQTAQYRYDATEIASLPQDLYRVDHWVSSFTRLDGRLSPRHTLIATGGAEPSRTKYANLGTFVPPDATIDLEDRSVHAAVTDRALWSDTIVSESTFRFQHYRTYVYPLGPDTMRLLPETTLGHFYNQQFRDTGTYQWVTAMSSTLPGPGGLHMIKAGIDVLHSRYEGTSASRPVLVARSDGSVVRRLDFKGATTQHQTSTDIALFMQDRLALNRRWYVEFGGRIDRDGILDRVNLTPRAGTAVLINDSGSAVLRGGFGLFYERTPSAAGAFDQFESWVDTRFDRTGSVVASSQDFSLRPAGDLRTARSATWNLAFDHKLSPSWSIHAGLLDRRGTHELIVNPVTPAGPSAVVLLTSDGRSRYREGEVGVDYTHRTFADVHATYVASWARGDLNSFTPFFGAIMSPIIGVNGYAPLSTDVPHRLLVRGRISPTPRWLLVGVADWRTGFPYSRVDEMLDFVGPRHSERFPATVRVELGAERRLKIGKLEPWIGLRANNAFNAFLPADVQANISSPAFGSFYNSEIRQFRLILRFAQ
jgi:Carboxypeptidase regulatory-like domain/TonB dependent receptor